jgi:hypothetical protein
MSDPMAIQHGGSHYKGMKIEPFQMSLANQYDGAIHSIVKYVSRHGAKGGAEDLLKAHHITAIRLKYLSIYGTVPSRRAISMGRYIADNRIDGPEATVLMLTDEWSFDVHPLDRNVYYHDSIRQTLVQIAGLRYPDFDLKRFK